MSVTGGRFLLLGIVFNFFLGLTIILNSLDHGPHQSHNSNSEVVIFSYDSENDTDNRVRRVNEALSLNKESQQGGNFDSPIIDYAAMGEEEKVVVSNETFTETEVVTPTRAVGSINHTHPGMLK